MKFQIIHKEPIKTFPFDRMSRAMEAVNWTWFTGRTPSGPEIQLEASQLFRELEKSGGSCIASGGVIVWRDGTVGFEAKSRVRVRECKVAWERAA